MTESETVKSGAERGTGWGSTPTLGDFRVLHAVQTGRSAGVRISANPAGVGNRKTGNLVADRLLTCAAFQVLSYPDNLEFYD
jgi:hypothetical protein